MTRLAAGIRENRIQQCTETAWAVYWPTRYDASVWKIPFCFFTTRLVKLYTWSSTKYKLASEAQERVSFSRRPLEVYVHHVLHLWAHQRSSGWGAPKNAVLWMAGPQTLQTSANGAKHFGTLLLRGVVFIFGSLGCSVLGSLEASTAPSCSCGASMAQLKLIETGARCFSTSGAVAFRLERELGENPQDRVLSADHWQEAVGRSRGCKVRPHKTEVWEIVGEISGLDVAGAWDVGCDGESFWRT